MRSRISTLLISLLALLTPALSPAQGFNPANSPSYVRAQDYGRWAIRGQAANTYTFQVSGFSPCQITQLNFGDSSTFYAFSNTAALAPVFISDVNSANSEVVTPGSYLTPTSTSCGPALSPSNSHTTFTLQSGSGGLQEALNIRDGQPNATIILDSGWYSLVAGISGSNATLTNSTTPADVITNATCASGEVVVDITTTPWTQYGCNASHKLVTMTPAPKVSVAAGAGAGTGPTIAILGGSSQGTGTITLTTGTTPTASAAVFTVTFPAPDYGGGFPYVASCTVKSVGTSAYTSGVVSGTAGSGTSGGTLVLTASSTALAASTSGFKFTYSCH